MRVTVVTYKGRIIKVAEDHDTAREWVQRSEWKQHNVNFTDANVIEAGDLQ